MPHAHSSDFSSKMAKVPAEVVFGNWPRIWQFVVSFHILAVSIFLGFPLEGASAALAAPIDPSGLWSTKDDESIIKIAPCDKFYCGTLVWLKEPNDAHGKPKLDDQNTDAAKRSRPMLGMEILSNMAAEKDHWRGTAYNADDGKFYDITFKVTTTKTPNDTGEIEGCILKILCKTEIFNRAPSIPGQTLPVALPAKQTAKTGPHSSNPPVH